MLSDKIKFKIIFSDDAYLLQFLRIRKFNIESACESFEKYFLYRKKYEKWCKFDRDDMTKLWELFDTGYAYPLTDRDDEGKKIIFIQARKFDTQKFTSVDAIRLIGLIVAILMEEDETQISGISTISDFTGVSFSYFKVFSIRDIKDFADCAKNATVGREKENYFVNLPIFASFLFEIGRKAISEKLRQRLINTRNIAHLMTYVDPNLLPKEVFGGTKSEVEMLEAFRKLYKTHESNFNAINSCDIDWAAVKEKNGCDIM